MTQTSETLIEIQGQLKELNAKCDTLILEQHILSTLITGNGNPSQGMIVRLDRLEQTWARRDTFGRAFVAGTITALFTLAGVMVKHFYFP